MLPSNLTGESPVHEPEWPHYHTHEWIEPRSDKEPTVVGPGHSVQDEPSCPGEEISRVGAGGRGGERGGAEEKEECEGKVDETERGAQEESGKTAK